MSRGFKINKNEFGARVKAKGGSCVKSYGFSNTNSYLVTNAEIKAKTIALPKSSPTHFRLPTCKVKW